MGSEVFDLDALLAGQEQDEDVFDLDAALAAQKKKELTPVPERKPLPEWPKEEEKSTARRMLEEVPGVLADYAKGAVKGTGRLATGMATLDPFNPLSAMGAAADIDRQRRKAEIDAKLGLEAEGGVQEFGGAIPYMAAGPQGIASNAALAGSGAFLETQDPWEAAKGAAGGALAGALVPAARAVGGRLMKSATNLYEKALHPTTRAAKVETAKIVPELLKRRVSGSLEDLAALGTKESEAVGSKIGQRYASSPKAVNASQLADSLESLKQPFMAEAGQGGVKIVGGKAVPVQSKAPVVIDDAAIAKIEEIQGKLREFGDAVPPKELWKYRQVLDRIVRQTGGFTKELSPESAGKISLEARRALQAELNRAVPDIQKLNAQYSLWEALQKVAGETALRKTGQQGLPGMLARGAGAGLGGAVAAVGGGGPLAMAGGAAVGSQVTKKLADFMASPAWRTMSAVNKARLADLLTSGNTEAVLSELTRLGTSLSASQGTR